MGLVLGPELAWEASVADFRLMVRSLGFVFRGMVRERARGVAPCIGRRSRTAGPPGPVTVRGGGSGAWAYGLMGELRAGGHVSELFGAICSSRRDQGRPIWCEIVVGGGQCGCGLRANKEAYLAHSGRRRLDLLPLSAPCANLRPYSGVL
jgi:hypothetical protein